MAESPPKRPNGGKRPGAGRPKGSLSGPKVPTRAKALVEEAYRSYMLQHAPALWQGQLERALGAFVLMVKTDVGAERVTDPAAIARVLALPERDARGTRYWWIQATAPDPVLIKEINNRLMGVPAQPHEVSTTHTLADILAGLVPKDDER